eukprot:m.17861 g.17861  ORF g.17861 m.17861 type:complete len:52 (-) comp7597_c1_seq1:46-201(-)
MCTSQEILLFICLHFEEDHKIEPNLPQKSEKQVQNSLLVGFVTLMNNESTI